jgi:hypothetical protein
MENFAKDLTPVLHILPYLSTFGISVGLIFLMTQVNRLLSKEIFQKFFFREEINMPSTNFLLFSNGYFERSIKERLRNKVKQMYDIELHNELDERQDLLASRKRIVMAVSQMRNSLRGNEMLFRHNIEYGFFRNLLGGCLLAVVISIFIIIYGYSIHNLLLLNIGIVMCIVYLLPILLSKWILSVFGNNYAKILYEQFLSLPNQ